MAQYGSPNPTGHDLSYNSCSYDHIIRALVSHNSSSERIWFTLLSWHLVFGMYPLLANLAVTGGEERGMKTPFLQQGNMVLLFLGKSMCLTL